jgi:exosortase
MITFPLQLLVTRASVAIVSFLGIPVLGEGNIINLPNDRLYVAYACSGLRSVSMLLALSTLYALNLRSITTQAIILLMGIPIAVSMNIIRVSISTILAYTYGASYINGYAHSLLGLSAFVLSILFLSVLRTVLGRFECI